MIGQKLSHYRILGELGRGGMGVVYRACDETLGRDVALKLLPLEALTDPDARDRLLREARTASALNHPNICTIHEAGEADGQIFFAMELVDGRPLRELIPPDGMPAESVARYGAQIADALAHAHGRGVIHRDLKPANVIVTAEGRAKVLDFGLARRQSREALEEVTKSRLSVEENAAVAGTLAYMAPEQLRGEAADAQSDIWALGVVLYEMASGTLPFRGATGFELSSAILRETPAPLPHPIPPPLRGVIQRCLLKEPGQRYQRASEVRAALETLGTVTAAPSTKVAALRPRAVSWKWAVAAATVLVVIAAVLALNVGGLRQRLFAPAGPPKIESLAVLPLENLSRDPEQEYFADGMTEALITELSKISALKVISRTSAMQYKGAKKPMLQVARELGVDALIEGSVLREGDQVRITVQLIHGPTDHHLWAQSFDRELRGILALHSEVARAISTQIQVQLTPQEQTRLASARAVNPKAYELYVLGRYHLGQRSLDGYRRAAEDFRKALELDPGNATTYAALADTYTLLGDQGGLPQSEARSLSEAAIRKALELDETLAEAHTSLGMWKLRYEWNWAEAEKEFKRAIELNPGLAAARQLYGRMLGFAGRLEEAFRELQRARELDPLSAPINAHVGQAYLIARQYDRAAEHLRQALDVNPNHAFLRHSLGEVYLSAGLYDEAVTELRRAVELSAEPSTHYIAMLGCAYARANRKQDAARILRQLQQRSQQGLVSAFDMAALYAALGDKEQALAGLEKGYEKRDVWLVELKAWPWFDSLRDEPRFQDLLRRMNFPP
jgi:serine/threonine-protein kinase